MCVGVVGSGDLACTFFGVVVVVVDVGRHDGKDAGARRRMECERYFMAISACGVCAIASTRMRVQCGSHTQGKRLTRGSSVPGMESHGGILWRVDGVVGLAVFDVVEG